MSKPEFAQLSQATPTDAPAIRQLVRDAYARWVPVIGREPLPMIVDYDQAVREHRFDLLRLGDDLLALIETIQEPDHLFVENVAVAPAQQGKGYGRQLLAHAEELARSLGLTEIRLLTNGAFKANVGLYQFVGYTIDRTKPFRGGLTVYMSKRL